MGNVEFTSKRMFGSSQITPRGRGRDNKEIPHMYYFRISFRLGNNISFIAFLISGSSIWSNSILWCSTWQGCFSIFGGKKRVKS